MKRQQCFKVVETSASTIEAEIVNDGETDQETINENNVIDQEISQENDEEIDQHIDQENDQQRDQEIEQLKTEKNINFNEDSKWTNQQKCV
ncbi:Hypothetical protein SRAE_0000064900 [Strongyloides ratti]|uniref:Uncharacterized protein n=1 Tax=Strongyloides ratti TaxID=34506 RepID=A0A090L069_STRRB|nr:Hypothetical protein SRAE_0000064900 [Strongyloides ratti]CEF61527.1 Hypothetical protein SRAE_0000064900 [Strongyloides ratti]